MKTFDELYASTLSVVAKMPGLAATAVREYLAEDAEIRKLIELASYGGFHDMRKVYLFGTGCADWSGIPRDSFLCHQRLPGICALRQHRRETRWGMKPQRKE